MHRRDKNLFALAGLFTILTLLCSSFFVVACQTLQGPRTTEDRIQYAKASLTATYKSIEILAIRKRISKDDGLRLLARADDARTALIAAETALIAGNGNDASTQLSSALGVLTALESALKEKEQPP